MARSTFSGWLESEMQRQGVSRRELARRLAHARPDDGKYVESQRRHVKRILAGKIAKPTQATRDSICDALGVPRDSAPKASDEEEESPLPLTPDELVMLETLMARLRVNLADQEAGRNVAVGSAL